MNEKNISKIFNQISKYFSPKIIGEVNDVFIKLALINGHEVPWHIHDNEDEMFYIIEGSLVMEIEGQAPFQLNQGEYYIVKKGINHRIFSEKDCRIMLIEPKETKHTGSIKSNITKTTDEQYY